MKKTNTTKQAFFTSILALLLCISMLVGTTFAWFTDEVISGKNTIAAGNLDIVLEYWDKTQEKYVEVTSETKLFDDAALWEPGHTEVAYLKVSNAGNLALKYQLGVNVYGETLGKTAAGADIKLSDHLVLGISDKQVTSNDDLYSREEARQDAGAVKGLQTYTGEETMLEAKNEAGDNNYYDYIALIVYMPESVGNKANHDGTNIPKIELGVKLSAIQKNYESDSFGSNYDQGLKPVFTYVSSFDGLRKALEAGESVALQDDIVVESAEGFMYTSGNGGLIYINEKENVTIDLNGHDIVVESTALMEGKNYANAVLLINKSTVNIIGDGSIIANNRSIPVYGLSRSTINIYGGTYKTNASERNESAVYVNNPNVMINVYGGNFMESAYAFNAHDTKCANTPVITLYEGVSYRDFLKNGTVDVTTADLKAGRIVLAEGMYVKNFEIDGQLVHQVAKKQDTTDYVDTIDEINAALTAGKNITLQKDVDLGATLLYIYGDELKVDLNGNDISTSYKNQPAFFASYGGSLIIEGDGVVTTGGTNAGDLSMPIWADESATVTVNGGTYQMGHTADKYHIYGQNSSKIIINDGTFITEDESAAILYCINSTIEINGGFFQNTANPNAALLSMGNNLSYVNNQKITLRGGTFVNWNPMSSAFAMDWPQCPALIVLADGYEMVSETQTNGDVWYCVVPVQ